LDPVGDDVLDALREAAFVGDGALEALREGALDVLGDGALEALRDGALDPPGALAVCGPLRDGAGGPE